MLKLAREDLNVAAIQTICASNAFREFHQASFSAIGAFEYRHLMARHDFPRFDHEKGQKRTTWHKDIDTRTAPSEQEIVRS